MREKRRITVHDLSVDLYRPDLPALQDVGESPLAGIEQDIRSLMKAAATARHEMRESEQRHEGAQRSVLLRVIDIGDGIDRLVANMHAGEAEATPQVRRWMANVRTLRRLLEQVLAEQGAIRLEIIDKQFNPESQRPVGTVVDRSRPDSEIAEEVEPGYAWRHQILRKVGVVIVENGHDRGDGGQDA